MLTNKVNLSLRPGSGVIALDGEALNGVRGLDLSAAAGEIPSLTVELLVNEVEVDGEMTVAVPDATREALIALGWTPPSAQL